MRTETNFVRTFNVNGECMYEEDFGTPEKAYKKYVEYVKLLKSRNEHNITVVRYKNDDVMSIETV